MKTCQTFNIKVNIKSRCLTCSCLLFLRRSRLAQFQYDCEPSETAVSGCKQGNYAACLLAYTGLIGTHTLRKFIGGVLDWLFTHHLRRLGNNPQINILTRPGDSQNLISHRDPGECNILSVAYVTERPSVFYHNDSVLR